VRTDVAERDVLADILDATGLELTQSVIVTGGRPRIYGPALSIVVRGSARLGSQQVDEGTCVLRLSAEPEEIDVSEPDSKVCIVGYRFSRPVPHPLFDRMPQRMSLGGDHARSVISMAHGVEVETGSVRPGWMIMITGLARALFIEYLRSYEEATPEEEYRSPLSDPVVYQALQYVHEDPGHDWSSEELAGAVGLSRATFYRRFTALIGLAPAKYLARWRLLQAQLLLGAGTHGVTEVAELFGYGSAAAFSRAFKRYAGAPPTDLLVDRGRTPRTSWVREVTEDRLELRKELRAP
jgi:AraC-like DNA-binding protein